MSLEQSKKPLKINMFKKSDKGYYFWDEFLKLGIIHGFSTRRFGDISIKNLNSDSLKKFCDVLGIEEKKIVGMRQVHGNVVSEASDEFDNIIDSTDGLVSSRKGVFLLGTFADCVPVLFFDKDKKIFGIAHAGWKGAYKEIVKVLISKMIDYGSSAQNILVGLGPSIRVCCYNIGEERKQLFVKKFPKWQKKILQKKDNLTFLDLQTIIKIELLESGILKANIKDCMVCTKDNMSDFYSYRGEKNKDSFGLFAAIIGGL